MLVRMYIHTYLSFVASLFGGTSNTSYTVSHALDSSYLPWHAVRCVGSRGLRVNWQCRLLQWTTVTSARPSLRLWSTAAAAFPRRTLSTH